MPAFVGMTTEIAGENGHPVTRVVAGKDTYIGGYWIIRLRGW